MKASGTASVPASRILLSGNEAIALGAWEAGVRVAAAYPGTPSTEILETLGRYPEVLAEWSPNEKVAFDVAVGAAYGGVRALTAMKHVGLNVAADSLCYAAYTGIQAGLVAVVADDPGMHSSQNEQDSRHYARLSKLPCLEPSDSAEARRFAELAFDLSESFDTPVLLRSTTRLSHGKSPLDPPGQRREHPATGFRRNLAKYVMVPGYARGRHPLVEQRLAALSEWAENFPGNEIIPGRGPLGVVTAGVAYQYVREVLPDAPVLKLGMVYPLPIGLLRRFAAMVERLLVVEELDPFLLGELAGLGISAEGLPSVFRTGELSPARLRLALGNGVEGPILTEESNLPNRPPVLCAGCGHRGVFYALKTQKAKVFGDIGCYSLGVGHPLEAMDTLGCMGAGIGVAHGIFKAGGTERPVAVIGDSTFFHSGIAPLLNLVYNGGHLPVIILDNRTTAMTGRQDHPGTGKTLQGTAAKRTDLSALCRALGVYRVFEVSPYDLVELRRLLRDSWTVAEPTVIIAGHPCVLATKERHPAPTVDQNRCNDCGLCLILGCPPITHLPTGGVAIDQAGCNGCGLCVKVCTRGAIRPKEVEN